MRRLLPTLVLAILLPACTHSGSASPKAGAVDPAAIKARADALLEKVGQDLFTGRPAEVEVAVAEALPLYRQVNDRQGEATCLLFQSLAKVAMGDQGAAMPGFERTFLLLEEARDRFSAWMVLWMMAKLEESQGNFDKALSLHERSLALLQEFSASPEPLSMDGLARWGKLFGAPGMDLEQLKTIAPIAKIIMLRFAEAIARDSYGGALVEANRLDDAEVQLTQAAEISRSMGGLFDSPVLAHLGDLRRRQWRFDEARESYTKALAGVGTLPEVPFIRDNWVEVQMLGQLAEIEILSGRLDEALAWNDRALVLEAPGDPRHDDRQGRAGAVPGHNRCGREP